MTVERRKEMRIPLFLQVGCQGLGDEAGDVPKFDLNCHDLSSHGMALECERPVGTDKTCRFSLPLFHSQEPLTVKGNIRWHKRLRDGTKIGVRFEEPIDLSLPFPVVKDAAARVQKDAEYYRAAVRNVLSDACVWLNPAGEILQYDQRVLALLNCTELDLKDKRMVEFFHPEDQEGIEWFFEKLKKSGDSLPVKRLLRLQSGGNMDTYCQISVPPKPPWSDTVEVYLKDVTQSYRMEWQNRQLEQVVRTFSRCINGKMVILSSDLTINEVRGRISEQPGQEENVRFRGMPFQKATGLAQVKMNGKTLWEQLRSCVTTGRPITGRPVTYWGRVDNGQDLIQPGDFRITVNPSQDSDKKVSFLVVIIEAMSSFGANWEASEISGDSGRLESILGSSATAFVLSDVIEGLYDPLARLVAQLDLLFSKVDMAGEKADRYEPDRDRVQALVRELCDRLKPVRENVAVRQGTFRVDRTDINECVSRAIDIVQSNGDAGAGVISMALAENLPAVKPDAHDLVMMFIIFLLTSKASLATVTDKTIRCETAQKNGHVMVKIAHNSYIQKQDDLKMIFDGQVLRRYFSDTGRVKPTETYLHYANFLTNKHRIKMNMTNIPGQFELCLAVPSMRVKSI